MTIARLSLLALLGVSMTTLAACGSSAEEPAVATISPVGFSSAYERLAPANADAVLFFDDPDLTTKNGSPTAPNEQARLFSGSGFAEDGVADTDTRGFRATSNGLTSDGLTGVGLTEANVQGISTATLYSGSPKFGTGAEALTPFHLSWSGGGTDGGPNTITSQPGNTGSDANPIFIAPGFQGLKDAGVIRVAEDGETPARTAGFTPLTQGEYLTEERYETAVYSKDPSASVGEFGPSVKNFANKPLTTGAFASGAGGLGGFNLEARTIDGASTYGWQGVPTGNTITDKTRDFDVDLIYPSVKDGAWKLQYSTFVLVRASLKEGVLPSTAIGDAPDRFLNVFTFVRNRNDNVGTDWQTTRGELNSIYKSAGTAQVKLEYEARLAAWGVVAKAGAEEVWFLFGKNAEGKPFTVTFAEEGKHSVLGKIEAYKQQVGSKAGEIDTDFPAATPAGTLDFEMDFRSLGLNDLGNEYDDDGAPSVRETLNDPSDFDGGVYDGGELLVRTGTFVGPVANEFVLEILITPPDAQVGNLPTYIGAVIGQRNGVPAIPVTVAP